VKTPIIAYAISLGFVINIAYGSVDPAVNVFELKHKIDEQSKQLQILAREMGQVESNLAFSNKKYSKLSTERAKLEEEIVVAKKNADLDNENLKKNVNETKNILMGVLLNKMEKEETPSNLLSKKILVESLQRRLIELDGLVKSNKIVMEEVLKISERLKDSQSTEKDLVAIMHDLDIRKKSLIETIDIENKKKESISQQFTELKNKTAMERESSRKMLRRKELAPIQITEEIKVAAVAQSIEGEFNSPLAMHQDIEYQKKGVTFTFQGKNEVRASKAGKIVYTGALANYGNVIMIDHGKEVRSVILGQFDYVVKNGDLVKDAELIGYTKTRSNKGLADGKIYFEVRKNNLAQNTYLLLDKKSLAKNSSK
jgi:murein DD-endopeptidase MepM/ murein hydrolase activator NlpD